MNKLYAFFDFLNINDAINYLSYLLNHEPITEIQLSCLIRNGQLNSYRDDYIKLQSITLENNKIKSFGKILPSKRALLFPNISSGITYQTDQNEIRYAYLIKDKQGKTYTAINAANNKILKPYATQKLADLSFCITDLIELAKQANKNNNQEHIEKPLTKKIPFQCFNEKNNTSQDYYVIFTNQTNMITNELLDEFADEIAISKLALLMVTGILLERLINKGKPYTNHNLNQSRIIEDIEKYYPNIRSLSGKNINLIFAQANAILKTIKIN